MSLDRTGEHRDDDPGRCPYDCRDGWLSGPDADVMRACPIHRPPAPGVGVRDYANRSPSLRAQQAIAAADRKERNR
ncbi:hypothetical protein ACW2Q0_00660 [Nocardia sp. R16R-3T]